VIFGSVGTAAALAAGMAAETLDTLYVEVVTPTDALTERGARLFIRPVPRAAAYGVQAAGALTRFLPARLNLPADALRVAVLHESGGAAEAIGLACEAQLREAGLAVVERLSHVPRTSEMPALAQRLRAAGIAVLLHAAGEGDAAALLRAMEEAGWRPRALIGVGSAWALAQAPGLEGSFALDVPPIASAEAWATGAQPFAEAYQRRWGAAPRSGLSLAAFAVARPVLAAPQRAALAALDLPEGELANGWGFRLDERGQNTRAAPVLMQVAAGAARCRLAGGGRLQPALMPRARMIGSHLLISAARKAAALSGVLSGTTSIACSTSLVRSDWLASARLKAALAARIAGSGVPAGASTMCQV
jgi:branched-chain amino acid transport system substrate-binding protein